MTLTIRPASPEEAPAIIGLWRACDLVTADNDPAHDFASAVQGLCSAVLAGVDGDGRIRGSVMVGYDGHRGWMYYVAADPGARRTGIGRQMVQAAEDWLRARGALKVQLLVRESNGKVVAFYERLGFAVTPRVVMAKWLPSAPP